MFITSKITDRISLSYHENDQQAGEPIHYPHTHDFCELYFHIAGDCSYMVDNGIFKVEPGTVIFTRPGELHCVHIDTACNYRRAYYQILDGAFDFLGVQEIMRCFFDRPFGEQNSFTLSEGDFAVCLSRLTRSAEVSRDALPDRNALMLADLFEILHLINNSVGTSRYEAAATRDELVSRALRSINRSIATLHSTDELAAMLYVSREYLSRRFSHVMGITLNRYITIKRVELAKQLLRRGASLSEVCEACGFGDTSYFIYVFRRETGSTPYQYGISSRG